MKKNIDKNDLKNPFHEAVANNFLEIVSMIMETVAAEVRIDNMYHILYLDDEIEITYVNVNTTLGAKVGLWATIIVSIAGEQNWQK